MTHSAFIAWLLKGETYAEQISFDDAMHPLRLFLNSIGVKEEEMKGIVSVETSTERMLSDLSENCNSAERLDIYVQVKRNGKQDIEVFIENKVYSSERNEDQLDESAQTMSYYNALQDRDASKYFVYLTVKGSEAKCKEFVPLSYQVLMDKVLVPLQATGKYGDRLSEYIAALETPAPDENGGKFDIMAMSAHTKQYYEAAFKEQWEQLGAEYKDKHAIPTSLKSALCSACYAKSGKKYQEEPVMKLINSKDLSKFNVTIDSLTTTGCGHKQVAELVVAKMVSVEGKKNAAAKLNTIKGKGLTILTDEEKYAKATKGLKCPQRKYEPIYKPGTNEVEYWLLTHWDHCPDRKSGNFDQLLKIVSDNYSTSSILINEDSK